MYSKVILTLIGIFISLNQFAGEVQDFNCDNEILKKCKCSELKDNFIVDCSNIGVKSVPIGIPSGTTHLYLNNNGISVLRNNSFAHSQGELPNLVTLNIRSNTMSTVEIKALEGLHKLKELDLYNNCLKLESSFPKSVFVPISQSLEVLDIRMNLLGDINQVDYPVSVGELVGLKELRIDCLRNKFLPVEYDKLKKITKISFTDGRKAVGFVGDGMFQAVSDLNITDIDLAGLDIGVIGNNTFLNLPKLKTLDLSNNEYLSNIIDFLPALNQTSIETLMLNNTGIGQKTTLMPIFKELGKLHLKQLTLDNIHKLYRTNIFQILD